MMNAVKKSNELFALLCSRRGWDHNRLRDIEDPSYQRLKGMDEMIEHLESIRKHQQLLVILPDFDMDGIISGVLGFAGFCELGFNTALYRPDPARGHGFQRYDIERILDQYPDAAAIITCDNGIDSYDGTDYAISMGLTVLITDHHTEIVRPGTTNLTPAHAVVDPARIGETYAHKGICGAHVLYQVILAYTSTHQPEKLDDISLLRLFAGIGTVSDVMPILYENRQLVRDSIAVAKLLHVQPELDRKDQPMMPDPERSTMMTLLRHRDHHPVFVAAFRGIAELIAHFAVIGKLRTVDDVDEGFYGFYLAPAFNAIRRMNTSLEDGFGIFFSDSQRSDFTRNLIITNELRKSEAKRHYQEINSSPQPYAPYIYLTDAPAGMLGLLANNLMADTGMPNLVLHDHQNPGQEMRGSARSPGWLDFLQTILTGGYWGAGHQQAFGVRVGSHAELPALAAFIEQQVQQTITKLLASGLSLQSVADLTLGDQPGCDAELTDLDLLLELTHRIHSLEPFGHGFEEPRIDVVIDLGQCRLQTMGAEQQHLRITLPNGLRALWWTEAGRLPGLQARAEDPDKANRSITLATRLSLNTFMGNTSVQFIVDELVR